MGLIVLLNKPWGSVSWHGWRRSTGFGGVGHHRQRMLTGLVLQSNRAASLLVWLVHIQIHLCSVYPLCVLGGSERGPAGPADLCVATLRELRRRIDVIHNRDELAVSNGNKLNLSEMFPAKL